MKFINCRIDVLKKVFRPRPETEFWVGKALSNIKNKKSNIKNSAILDIFSGSGCIGIAVLKSSESACVDFVDISKDAISQIKINLNLNKIPENRYKIYQSNLFEKLKGKKYDFIFANPPYVALDRIGEVQKEVLKKDPHVALFAGKDGMLIIEKFLSQVKKYLKPDGKIFMEFDPQQTGKIKEILKKESLNVQFKKDQFGKIR